MSNYFKRILGFLRRTSSYREEKEKFKALQRNMQLKDSLYLQYRPDFDRLEDALQNIPGVLEAWIKGVEQNNLGDLNRLYFLYVNLKEVLNDIPFGDVAELGVYKGNSAKLMTLLAPERTIYLFDTYEGFDQRDIVEEGIPDSWPRYESTLESVRSVIGNKNNVKYIKGYFPDTTVEISNQTMFAFVHLDCDLYKPTSEGLEYFYPRLVPGGMLVIHDYYSGYWPGVKKAVDEYLLDKSESLIHIPDKSGTVALRKTVIQGN